MVTLLLSLSIQRLLPDSDATPELDDDKVNLPAKSFPLMVRGYAISYGYGITLLLIHRN